MTKVLSSLKEKKDKNITYEDCTDISEAIIYETISKENPKSFEKKGQVIENYMVALWFNNNPQMWKDNIKQEEKEKRQENTEIKNEHIQIIKQLLNNEIKIQEAKEQLPQPTEYATLKSTEVIKEKLLEYGKNLPEHAGKKDQKD